MRGVGVQWDWSVAVAKEAKQSKVKQRQKQKHSTGNSVTPLNPFGNAECGARSSLSLPLSQTHFTFYLLHSSFDSPDPTSFPHPRKGAFVLSNAMSTRKTDRVSLARHHHPQSPFGRAEETSHEFEFETNLALSPPTKQNGTRPRQNYRTGTLAGAYRVVSRTSMSEEGVHMGSTPSPRQPWNRIDKLSPTSDISNPPEELVDAYRRIEEDGTLADYVQWDDPEISNRKSSPGRLSRSSSRQRGQEYDGGSRDGRTFSEGGLFDGIGQNSPRRTTDYSRDEQRLRRVTGKDSPVFSKAKTSHSALTADNLQRREKEERPWEQDNNRYHQEQQPTSDYEGDRGPSLNLPRTWGSRAARRQEWLRNVSGSSGSEPPEKGNRDISSESSAPKTNTNDLQSSRPFRLSSHKDQASASNRGALEERVANLRTQSVQETKDQAGLGLDQQSLQVDGAAIPNTPIVVYKNSNMTRPNTTNRDSQELLRRLSRTESPKLDQVQTPDPPKLFERKIYDKTPRVTGAWIDTPMTERVVDIPSDLTKNIVAPPAPPDAKEEFVSVLKPAADVKPAAEQKDSQLTEDKRASPEPIITKQSKLRAPLARPKLPKSALETVIEDASSGKEALNMGDDTIESLQAILNDPTDLKVEEDEEAAYKHVLDRLGLSRRNSEGIDDYDRIDTKLQSLAHHITEVKKGLDRLQGHVANGFEDLDVKKETTKPTLPISTPTLSESGKTRSTPSDTRVYAAFPLPRLWERNLTSRRLQLTKLGWTTLIFTMWYIIECTMTEMYSHSFITDTCTGYCLRPDAPVFPFVTVTMLWRWSHLSTFLAPIITLGIALFRLVAQLLGLWDGYVEEPAGLANLIGEIRINGTPVAFPWLTPPSKTKGFSPSSILPPPPPPPRPEWTARHDAPSKVGDDQASMDDDEYL